MCFFTVVDAEITNKDYIFKFKIKIIIKLSLRAVYMSNV